MSFEWFGSSSQSIMIGIHAKLGHALSMEEQVFPRAPNGFSRLGSARKFSQVNYFTVFRRIANLVFQRVKTDESFRNKFPKSLACNGFWDFILYQYNGFQGIFPCFGTHSFFLLVFSVSVWMYFTMNNQPLQERSWQSFPVLARGPEIQFDQYQWIERFSA